MNCAPVLVGPPRCEPFSVLALEAQTPHGASIAANDRDTGPQQVFRTLGNYGCSRPVGPLRPCGRSPEIGSVPDFCSCPDFLERGARKGIRAATEHKSSGAEIRTGNRVGAATPTSLAAASRLPIAGGPHRSCFRFGWRSRRARLAAPIRAGLQQGLMIPHPVGVPSDVDDVAMVHETGRSEPPP